MCVFSAMCHMDGPTHLHTHNHFWVIILHFLIRYRKFERERALAHCKLYDLESMENFACVYVFNYEWNARLKSMITNQMMSINNFVLLYISLSLLSLLFLAICNRLCSTANFITHTSLCHHTHSHSPVRVPMFQKNFENVKMGAFRGEV